MEELVYNNYLMIDPFRECNVIVIATNELEAKRKYINNLLTTKHLKFNYKQENKKPITFNKLEEILPSWAGLYKIDSPLDFVTDSHYLGSLTISYKDINIITGTQNFEVL